MFFLLDVMVEMSINSRKTILEMQEDFIKIIFFPGSNILVEVKSNKHTSYSNRLHQTNFMKSTLLSSWH